MGFCYRWSKTMKLRRSTLLCFCATAFSKRKPIDHTRQWSVTLSLSHWTASDSEVLQETSLFLMWMKECEYILCVHVHLTTDTNLSAPEPIWAEEQGLHLQKKMLPELSSDISTEESKSKTCLTSRMFSHSSWAQPTIPPEQSLCWTSFCLPSHA